MLGAQLTQVKVAVQGPLLQPLASVILAVSVQVPGAVQAMVLTTVPLCPVRCAVSQPLKSTVKGPVPPVMVMVKSCDKPTQIVAEAGVIAQTGLGVTINTAEQGLLQPNTSVTVAV